MADYKGIKGFTVQNLSADPPAPIVGQVWYNSTSATLKGYTTSAGAWSSGGNVNDARDEATLTGTVTAGLLAGGKDAVYYKSTCETYNGSTWTEVGDLQTGANYAVSFGTNTAAIKCGGFVSNDPFTVTTATETWNGSSWATSPITMNTARQKMSSSNNGTTTAGLIFGGMLGPTAGLDVCESWDGSAWTEVGDLNSTRGAGGGGGTQTAAFLAGGRGAPGPALRALCETWNGTSWSEVNDLNTAREALGSAGLTTSALVFGGTPSPAYTEQWDGTSWTEVADLATGREAMSRGTGASGTSALAAAGAVPAVPAGNTEEWDGAPASTVTFTAS
jgi:hypothetical protein